MSAGHLSPTPAVLQQQQPGSAAAAAVQQPPLPGAQPLQGSSPLVGGSAQPVPSQQPPPQQQQDPANQQQLSQVQQQAGSQQQQQQQQPPPQPSQQQVSTTAHTHTLPVSSHPTYVSPSLYIGDLHPDVTEAMLFEVFNSVGPVTSIRVCRDSVTRRSLGYAYVNYQTLQDAERSLDALNYTLIRGQPCRIMWSQRDPTLRKSGSGNVFVKNLDRSIDNKALYDTFSLFGNILSCKVGVDEANRSKGYGFVHYESEASARNAIEKVNGMLIGGKTVYVGPFVTRSERENASTHRYTNVYLKNLPRCWQDADALRPILEPFGEITSLLVKQDPKGRLFAFCNYAEHDSAKACVQTLNGKVVNSEGFKETSSAASSDAAAATQTTSPAAEGEAEDGAAKTKDAAAAGNTNSSNSTNSSNGSSTANGSGASGEAGESSSSNNNNSSSSSDEMILFVGPHQSRAQRAAALRMKYEQQQQERGERYRGVNLYVKNLDNSVDDDKLRELFEPFGPTSSVKVMRDEKGVSRGFGFVCFVSPDDASKAVAEMHLKYINGKPLYTGLAERREQRLQRLQQRFRMPQLRQGAAAAVPGHVSYPGAAAALPGVAAYQQRAMMYPAQSHMAVLPWAGRQQQQQLQQQGLALQRGIPPAALQHIYAPQSAVAAAAALQVSLQQQQQQQPIMQQQRGAPTHRAARGGAAGSAKQQQQQLLKQQQQLPGGGSFKFTPQVRNPRVDQQQQPQQPPPPLHVQQQQQQPLEAAHVLLSPEAPLTAAALAAAQPSMQKQMLGERLFPLIARHQPELAGKITGMMLEMDNSELLILLESETQLKNKIEEALGVLRGAN
ncbi:polyadenylate-binding protein, putative [Eimeria acervulina]|uniref:Polyadenylate-binding protein n=1 Tax=Eimeria acervulina TaxID=5801 RepID=U6GN33_EIMAC|nr:polyadenylate-binding protein, putative [Eimeria acervulina]CDI80997.1 polyadenylate-binding protein, putative [Eimeria acervulina]